VVTASVNQEHLQLITNSARGDIAKWERELSAMGQPGLGLKGDPKEEKGEELENAVVIP